MTLFDRNVSSARDHHGASVRRKRNSSVLNSMSRVSESQTMSNKLNGSSTVVRETASTTILPELVASWNETATEFPRDKTIAQLFEETVSAHPDSIALVFGTQRLSFSELN